MKEFQQKIKELRDRLDFEHGTAQKNKTLLLTLKELCQTTLAETKDPAFKQEIKKELQKIEADMTKIKGISHEPEMGKKRGKTPSSVQDHIFTPQRPTKEALTSIQAGGFDPSSSPILRKLAHKSVHGSKIGQLSQNAEIQDQQTSQATRENLKSAVVPETAAALETSVQQTMEETEQQIKKLQSSLSEIEPGAFPGFPSQDAGQDEEKLAESKREEKYQSVKLIIAQLETEIRLDFKQPEYRIGREMFTAMDYPLDLPENFFEPILPITDPQQKPSEHCVILQPEKRKFILKDRADLQKTFVKGQFLTSEGVEIKPGDTFILPVLVNNSLASLSVEFQPIK